MHVVGRRRGEPLSAQHVGDEGAELGFETLDLAAVHPGLHEEHQLPVVAVVHLVPTLVRCTTVGLRRADLGSIAD